MLSTFFLFLTLSSCVFAESEPGTWWGTLNISTNTTPTGALIDVYVNGTLMDSTTFGRSNAQYYITTVSGQTGDNVSIRVYGVPVAGNGQTWSAGDHRWDLNMTPKTNGNACTYNGGCLTGFCTDGYCCDSQCAGSTNYCNVAGYLGACTTVSNDTAAASSSSGSSQNATKPLENATGTPKEQPNVTIKDVVTQPATEVKTNTNLQSSIKKMLKVDSLSEEALEAMITNSQAISQEVSVRRELAVMSTSSTVTTTLSYVGATKAKNVIIHDLVPKTIASSAHLVTVNAPGVKSWEVVNADPEFAFLYAELAPGQSIEINYTVSKQLNSTVLNQMNLGIYAEEIEKPPSPPAQTVCTAGQKRCDNSALQKCSADGMDWDTVEVCSYGCDPEKLACIPYIPNYLPVIVVVVVIIIIIAFLLIVRRKKV